MYRVTSKLRDNIFTNKAMNNHGTGTGKFVLNTSLHGRARDGTPIGSHQFSKTSQFLDGNATSRHSFDPMLHPHAAHSPSVGPWRSELMRSFDCTIVQKCGNKRDHSFNITMRQKLP